jgi:Family of unknown function (DUF5946)
MPDDERCPGCGLELPAVAGPTHPYIGASAACWALYGELLAREYEALKLPEGHRLTVDAYAVQHPGRPERRAIQSVSVHLIALHLVLERGEPPEMVTARLGELKARLPALTWLDPPQPNGTLTVEHVLAASPEEHHRRAREWATDVWQAWRPYHELVRGWGQRD